MSNNSKMTRQLMLYRYITKTRYHGPDELMEHFKVNRRMLQRDLKDLRDAGVVRLTLDKKENNYVYAKEPPVFDESVTGRRRQHLVRLKRLTTLIDKLERTDLDRLSHYESEVEDYEWYKECMAEDPEKFPSEDLGEPPEKPVLEDIKGSYYSLFPDSNERMRQRDFNALNDIGYKIYYSHKYRTIIFEDYWEYSDYD